MGALSDGAFKAPPIPGSAATGPTPVDIGDSQFRTSPAAASSAAIDIGDSALINPPAPTTAARSASPVDIGDSALRASPDNTAYTRDLSRGGTAGSGPQATVTLVESAKGAKAGTRITASVTCPSGQELRSGGGSVQTSDGENPARAVISQSSASSTTTWTVVGVVSGDNLSAGQALDVTAIGVCG